MDMKETKRILAAITAIYPSFIKDRDPAVLSQVWQQVFVNTPYPLVNQALNAFIATDVKGFPPTPGALNAFIRKAQQLNGPTEDDAWLKVYKAISRGLYNSREEFDKLPPDIQKIVGSPRMLFEWAHMDSDDVNKVIAAHFKRSWRTRQEHEQNFLLIPESPSDPLLTP
ncbi:hypothetical protein JRC49_09625 [Clostridiales bacterium FE2011]|nr:hypothetical protein JRC49_09625 [Clostridiales bacterium FE2011]